MNKSLGEPLIKALTAFAQGDYETTVSLIKPIRYDLVRNITLQLVSKSWTSKSGRSRDWILDTESPNLGNLALV